MSSLLVMPRDYDVRAARAAAGRDELRKIDVGAFAVHALSQIEFAVPTIITRAGKKTADSLRGRNRVVTL